MVCSGRVFAYCLQVPRFDFSLQKETKVSCRIHHFYILTYCCRTPTLCLCISFGFCGKHTMLVTLSKARHVCFIHWFPLLKSILPEIPRLLCREDVLSTNPWCELGRSEASEGCFHVWLRYPAYSASVREHPAVFLLLFSCGQNFLSFLPVLLTSHQRSPTVLFL